MLSRAELDGKGVGSPEGLVAKILKVEPSLSAPIPIERICQQLDISSIEYNDLDGLEGGLITNTERENGIILVQKSSHRFRQRFTIAHELGHFLIPTHLPDESGRFLCSQADMLLQHAAEQDKRARMEVEANRFSSLLLMPPPVIRSRFKVDPSLSHLTEMAFEFEVSKEAMARAYASQHDELLAFIVTHNGIVRRIYKHFKFPFIALHIGQSTHSGSLVSQNKLSRRGITNLVECLPDLWIDVERGKPAPKLYEQVMHQRDGFAMTMLWVEVQADSYDEDEGDKDENRTSAQRYRERISRYSR